MPKFFRGVVPAWLTRRPRPDRCLGRESSATPLARAAKAAVEALEQRTLFAVTTLTNGPGDGSLAITVDAYGAYGYADPPAGEALFDPAGAAKGSPAQGSATAAWNAGVQSMASTTGESGRGTELNGSSTQTSPSRTGDASNKAADEAAATASSETKTSSSSAATFPTSCGQRRKCSRSCRPPTSRVPAKATSPAR